MLMSRVVALLVLLSLVLGALTGRMAQVSQATVSGAEEAVRTLIQQENDNSISFGNARGVRNLFEDVLVRQAGRLAAAENITAELLMEIRREDILPASPAAE